MSATGAPRRIDLRGGAAGAAPGTAHDRAGFAAVVVPAANAPVGSDGPDGGWTSPLRDAPDDAAALRRVPSLAWRPSARAYEQAEELAGVPQPWTGLVSCAPHDCGGSAALSEWAIGPIAAVLDDAARPLALDLHAADPAILGAVFVLAAAHPTLAIVLRLDGAWDTGLLLALVRAAPNVLVESSGLSSDGLSRLAALDAGRLVFGSGFPRGDPAAELLRVEQAAPDAAALERITVSTAVRLMFSNE